MNDNLPVNTLRIPTNEQYAYIEIEFFGTPEDAISEYNRLTKLVKGGTELPRAQFNEILEKMIKGESVGNSVETWEGMSQFQQDVCKQIKLAHTRINR